LTQVFEPFVVLAGLIAAPLALRGRTRLAYALVTAFLIVALSRYLPAWVSLPANDSPTVTVATWNVLGGAHGAERALEGVAGIDADLIALVELQPRAAAALQAQEDLSARFPYSFLNTDVGLEGTGLLSRYPIIEAAGWTQPAMLRALVDVPDRSAPLVVYVIHPFPPDIRMLARLPVSLDTAQRDEALGQIRASVEADVASGQTVLIAGDFNTTEREPAYHDFVRGLRDAHLDAGVGPGFTWRPASLEWLPFGVVRIDYLLTTPDLRAVSTHVVCGRLSDHCVLQAALAGQPDGTSES
jgi:endonuclease/exonuclease/phosphatase family metal-dependent hydrolase